MFLGIRARDPAKKYPAFLLAGSGSSAGSNKSADPSSKPTADSTLSRIMNGEIGSLGSKGSEVGSPIGKKNGKIVGMRKGSEGCNGKKVKGVVVTRDSSSSLPIEKGDGLNANRFQKY